jgi:DNA-binding response OmpR family regulator
VNSSGGNRVLVVEPDSWARALLLGFLTSQGFEAAGAADADDAKATAAEFDPHVLLSNYQLADGVTGVDLALALRRVNALLGLVFLSKLPEQDLGLPPGADVLTGAQYFSSGDAFSADGLKGAVERALTGVERSK